MENQGKQTGAADASTAIRLQYTEDRISGIGDMGEDISLIDISVKKSVKPKKFLTQNIQEIWDTMKTPNQKILGIEERKDSQLKGTKNIYLKL